MISVKELKICSYNVRNDNLSLETTNNQIKEIYHKLIEDNKIEVLATQEMVSSTLKVLKESLNSYRILGNYRYGKSKLVRKIPILEKYNEANNIITNLQVLTEKTTELPWLPRNLKELYKGIFKYKSITPRIMTEAILEVKDYGRVRFINTHLSHHLKGIESLQLRKLKSRIKSSTIPVVLTGDFNMSMQDKTFSKFVEDVEKIGLKRIALNGRTFKNSRKAKAIDHIFIPSNWEVKEIKTIDEKYLDNYSDHYPILVTVIPKK